MCSPIRLPRQVAWHVCCRRKKLVQNDCSLTRPRINVFLSPSFFLSLSLSLVCHRNCPTLPPPPPIPNHINNPGARRFSRNMKTMHGYGMGPLPTVFWCFLTPAFTMVCFVRSFIHPNDLICSCVCWCLWSIFAHHLSIRIFLKFKRARDSITNCCVWNQNLIPVVRWSRWW